MKFSIAAIAAVASLVSAEGWEQWSSTEVEADPTSTWGEWEADATADPTTTWGEWEAETTSDPTATWGDWDSSESDPTATWGEWDASVTDPSGHHGFPHGFPHGHGFPSGFPHGFPHGFHGHKTVAEDEEATTTWEEWSKTTDPAAETTEWSEWSSEGGKPDGWTTTVVTAITTYIPKHTTITHAGKTYTVDAGHTLTVTDCPCTISVPVWTKTSTACDPEKTPDSDSASSWAAWSSAATPDASSASSWAAWSSGSPDASSADPSSSWGVWNTVTTGSPDSASSTWAAWESPSATNKVPIATWTGAASRNVAAGLAGVAGFAALLL